jgi:hypothetical protein
MNHTFLQSIKTITESLIERAGFDKTRSGQIVDKNASTNLYSVKVDGNVYNNISTVNDSIYNIGDIVKIKIPVNQMSQAYIASAVYSEGSFGKRLNGAESSVDNINDTLNSLVVCRSATSDVNTLEPADTTGYGKAISITLPTIDGYTLVGVATINTNHNIACGIGRFIIDQTNNTINVTISNRTSTRFTDLTATVQGWYIKSNVYGGDS